MINPLRTNRYAGDFFLILFQCAVGTVQPETSVVRDDGPNRRDDRPISLHHMDITLRHRGDPCDSDPQFRQPGHKIHQKGLRLTHGLDLPGTGGDLFRQKGFPYRTGNYFVPKGDTELNKGDKLLVVSDNNDELIRKVEEMGIENVLKMQ